MNYSNFISVEYLFKHTIIDDNVDSELLKTFIKQAQDINIQQMLGVTLYNKLMNDVSSATLSSYYKTLIDNYVQPATAEWTVYHCLPFINYRLTNKSISEKRSDNSDAADLDTVKYLREVASNKAEFYSQRIQEYIMNNLSQFPEYGQIDGLGIQPSKTAYFSGIYTGRENDC